MSAHTSEGRRYQHLHSPLSRARSGVSLLISLILVGVIVLFSLTVSNIVITSVRQSANVNRANEAYYAAEGGIEQGLLENQKQGSGYTSSGATDLDYTGSVKASYQVQGQVPANAAYGADVDDYAGMYGIPTPGTGNVMEGCDPLKAEKDNNTFDVAGATYSVSDADHPCNWNRIKFGETVSIPLYYTDVNGVAHNLFTNGVTDQLILRLRTPCTNGANYCSNTQRFLFNYVSEGDLKYGYDDPIFTWQIIGIDLSSNNSLVLDAWADFITTPGQFNGLKSTLVSEKKISIAAPNFHYEVVSEVSKGVDPILCPDADKVSNYLLNAGCWAGQAISKPVLKMSVIKNMVSDQSDTVPYLEYQILTDFSTAAPTDASQTIKSEGYSGTFKQVLEVKQPQESGLLEYVIQQ